MIADIERVDTEESLIQISNIEVVASFSEKYSEVKLQVLKEELRVTAHFWLKYIDMIETLYQLQFAIYTNIFPLKLMA